MKTKTPTAVADLSPLAGTISTDDLQHREDFWAFVLNKADPQYRAALTRLLPVWEDANDRYYGGILARPILLLAEPSIPRAYGDCGPVSGWGARSQIRIRLSLLTGTHPHMKQGTQDPEGLFRYVADVLLHEQIHQWQQEVTGKHEDSYHGHGPTFRAKCNEIGAALGLAPVIVKKRPGHDGPPCPQWPHNVQPPERYLGAYVPPNGDTEDPGDDAELREIARCRAYLEQHGFVVTSAA
jgi:hypothetical protein